MARDLAIDLGTANTLIIHNDKVVIDSPSIVARDRISGKVEVHRRLQIDPRTAEPKLKIFSTCTNLIRTLSSIPTSKTNPEDVDTKSEDHLYDALRYGIMTRPRSSIWDFNPATHRSGFQASDPTFGY